QFFAPLAGCQIVQTKAGAEFPVTPTKVSGFRLACHKSCPSYSRVHVCFAICAKFAHENGTLVVFSPLLYYFKVKLQHLLFCTGTFPFGSEPTFGPLYPLGPLMGELEGIVVVEGNDDM